MTSLLLGCAMLTVSMNAADNPMIPILERFRQDERDLSRFYNIDPSPARFARLEKFYAEQVKLAKAAKPGNPEAQLDQDLFLNLLDWRQEKLAFSVARAKETAPLLPFAEDILSLEMRRREMLPVQPEAAAKILEAIGKKLEEAEKVKATPVVALRASKHLNELDQALDTWYKSYAGYKPDFDWWCKKPYEAVDKALKDFAKHLRNDLAGFKEGQDAPLIGDPIGEAQLLKDLKHEWIKDSPQQLVEIAQKELAWCEAEMKKAAAELGFKDDWKKALEHVKNLHVPIGEQDMLMAELGKEAEKWVMDRDLVTVEPLCQETWRTMTMTPEIQKNMPFSGYFGQAIGVSHPHESMDLSTRGMVLRGNNTHFTRAIVGHELIPGHHLQGYMADRYRAYREVFSTPFYIEGWALHWELLLWDLNFARGPEDKIGMLFWRMHRAARIVVSLDFHLGKMKPEAMIDYLVERIGHERWTATSEVRRFIGEDYSPLYQCAYMIGGLQLRELYQLYVGTKKVTPKQFHDFVLKQNSVPIEAIGRAMKAEFGD